MSFWQENFAFIKVNIYKKNFTKIQEEKGYCYMLVCPFKYAKNDQKINFKLDL